MDNLTRDLKIKSMEDDVNKILENMPRLEQLIMLNHLPKRLGIRPGADLPYEISNECRKDEKK